MQETISDAVYEALQRVHVTTDADREAYREAYGHPVEEGDDFADYPGMDWDDDEDGGTGLAYGLAGELEDDEWDELEGYEDREPLEPVLGYEVGGENADLAALISEALLAEGDVDQKDGKRVFDSVLASLNDFPKKVINGREQNYFVGTPEQFAKQVAEKIEAALESKGLLGKIKGFLKLRK